MQMMHTIEKKAEKDTKGATSTTGNRTKMTHRQQDLQVQPGINYKYKETKYKD